MDGTPHMPTDKESARMVIAGLELENKKLDTEIEAASTIDRALGRVGLGKIPLFREQRAANRMMIVDLEDNFGLNPWDDPEQD